MNEARPAEQPLIELRVEPVAWAMAAAAFLGMRFAVTWQAPVGAEELRALSGAWEAAHGSAGDRFVPTFFQAVAAWLFLGTASEVAPRLFAFAATASIPAAIYLLRPVLGTPAALVALAVLAFDAPGIYTGVAATTSGFDLALVAWGYVLLARPDLAQRVPAVGWSLAGFLFATAGAVVLPGLLAALVVCAPGLRGNLDLRHVFGAGGAAAGILAASLGFGVGDVGVSVPPLAAFAQSFEDVSTLSAWDIVVLYAWPILVVGAGGAIMLVLHHRDSLDAAHWLLVAWGAAAGGWVVAALPQGGAVVVASATLPAALLAGYAVVAAVPAIRNADWNIARFAVPVGVAMAAIGFAYTIDWARVERVGSDTEIARVVALFSAALAAFAVAAVEARSRAALLLPGLIVAAIALVAGGTGVGLSGSSEPLPSPISPEGARVLRELALEAQATHQGEIVVHPDFRDEVLWPFRDSGTLTVASRVPGDAAIVLWPADQPQPDGFAAVEGEWSLLDEAENPARGWLQVIRWYSHRNYLAVSHSPMAVYIRSE